MFDTFITELRQGRLPSESQLKAWFNAALTKKLGVLKQPYLLWPHDPKINPPVKYLFWAAILLENINSVELVKVVIENEMKKRGDVDGKVKLKEYFPEVVNERIVQFVEELLELTPDDSFREKLALKLAVINKRY